MVKDGADFSGFLQTGPSGQIQTCSHLQGENTSSSGQESPLGERRSCYSVTTVSFDPKQHHSSLIPEPSLFSKFDTQGLELAAEVLPRSRRWGAASIGHAQKSPRVASRDEKALGSGEQSLCLPQLPEGPTQSHVGAWGCGIFWLGKKSASL